MEMQEPENEELFESRSLKIRSFYRQMKTPYKGINLPDAQGVSRKFRQKIEELNKNSFMEDRELSKVIVNGIHSIYDAELICGLYEVYNLSKYVWKTRVTYDPMKNSTSF